MKQKKRISLALAFAAAIPITMAQGLYEKRYDLNNFPDQIYSSIKFIPEDVVDNIEGYVLASSSLKNASPSSNTIIERVSIDGSQIWTTDYNPTGNQIFDRDLQVKSHRVGYFPVADNTVGNIVVVGQVLNSGYMRPGYIELDPATGNIVNETYFNFSSWLGEGHLNAAHTLVEGQYRGLYMVGQTATRGFHYESFSPILIKTDGSTGYTKVMELGGNWEGVDYLDVDVNEDDGTIVAVGYYSPKANNFGSHLVIDVFDNSGTLLNSFRYTGTISQDDIHRLTSVKTIGKDKVIVGGSMYNYRTISEGIVMEVDISNGTINWMRNVVPGNVIDPGTGIPVSSIGEIVEIELDKEAMPIIMGIKLPQDGITSDPTGPGLFARLHNNGEENWAVSELMDDGFGDLEPQHSGLKLLTSLTGLKSLGFTNKLIFAEGNSKGFSGCESKIDFNMPVYWDEITDDGGMTYIIGSLSNGTNTPSYLAENVVPTPGCCWLPSFNPVPWNHPWESTYWNDKLVGANLDAGVGPGAGYTYVWETVYTKEVWTGNIVSTGVTGGSQFYNIPFKGLGTPIYTGSLSSEVSRVNITVTDGDGCTGWDGTVVHIADDKIHNIPDYNDPNNSLEHEDYFYCQTSSTSPQRYIYEHQGGQLSSNGFPGVPIIASPHNVLNLTTPNYLAALGTRDFYEDFDDGYNAGGTPRNNSIHTDIKVGSCNNCNPNPGSVEKVYDDGRYYYTYEDRTQPIVKYSWSIHLPGTGGLPDKVRLLKRREAKVGSGPVDYLLPTIDDRYLDDYPLYAGQNEKLYLDIWFENGPGTYPYSICGHTGIIFNNAIISRLANPNGGNNHSTTNQLNESKNIAGTDTKNSIMIFPNPSNGYFEIVGLPENAEIAVYDAMGKMVRDFTRVDDSASKVQFDLADQENGLYFINVRTLDGKLFVHKVMKN